MVSAETQLQAEAMERSWFSELPGPALETVLSDLGEHWLSDLHHVNVSSAELVASLLTELQISPCHSTFITQLTKRFPNLARLHLRGIQGTGAHSNQQPSRTSDLLRSLCASVRAHGADHLHQLSLSDADLDEHCFQAISELACVTSLLLHACSLAPDARLPPLQHLKSLALTASQDAPHLAYSTLSALTSLTALCLTIAPSQGGPQHAPPTPDLTPLTNLRALHLDYPPHATSAVTRLATQITSLTALTALHFAGFKPASWIDFTAAAALSQLRSLLLPKAVLDFATSEAVAALRNLTRLHVGDLLLLAGAASADCSIRELAIGTPSAYTVEHWPSLMALPQLQRLTWPVWRSCRTPTRAGLPLLAHVPQLQLQMHSPEVAKDALLLQQLANMANLRSLQLIGSSVSCSAEEAAAGAVSLSSLTQLTELELDECSGWLSAEVLLQLVAPLCRLQVLRLHRCAGISVQGMQQVVAGQQEVRRVELAGCEGLGRREARQLRRALLGSRAGVEVCVVQELLA